MGSGHVARVPATPLRTIETSPTTSAAPATWRSVGQRQLWMPYGPFLAVSRAGHGGTANLLDGVFKPAPGKGCGVASSDKLLW